MALRNFLLSGILTAVSCLVPIALVHSQEPAAGQEETKKPDDQVKVTSGTTAAAPSSAAAKPALPPHATILKDAKTHTGMLAVYQKGQQLFCELTPGDYNAEFFVAISIARGIGQRPILGGYSWGFGDDWVWKFRKIDNRVHVIRRNVRFKANPAWPEGNAVKNAFTDSVLFALPVVSKGPRGGDLVDFTSVFMSDLPQISQVLPGFAFSGMKSSWDSIKAFKSNLELELAATYASSGRAAFDTVADSRGVTINIHYSISKIPSTGYQPRLADDRVGFFMTVQKDFSRRDDSDQFVRYINRWHLQKPADASTAPYPPQKRIIFWIEKTVPSKYRPIVRAGIAEWNKAFEKAGWQNAIEVRQQTDADDFDPEDIRFNTFRWMTADAGFAMGPSRVNPYTGQILDADIIFDADFLKFWKREFETFDAQSIAAMTGGRVDREALTPARAANELLRIQPNHQACRLNIGMAKQLAFGTTALLGRLGMDAKSSLEEQEKLIAQALKEVVMHEVGHTLGLRHNFKGSKLYTLAELNDSEKMQGKATVGSVMDYNPTNLVPQDLKQGDYYPTTIGPYDYWAIEYGYKPLSGGPSGEVGELNKIATRSGEKELQYATDEDTVGTDPDPDSNRFDLGADSLEYANAQAAIVKALLPNLMERMSADGQDYTKVRRAFNVLLAQHGQAMFYASRYIGGLHTSRSHKGDKDAKPPISPVVVQKQRDTLSLLEEQVFSDAPYAAPNEIYSFLAASRWKHWGTSSLSSRKDYPLHDQILLWQNRVLDQLLSSVTLERIHDTELKTSVDEDLLTTAELIERLTKTIFSEVDTVKEGEFTNRKPAISSLRRNLQRTFLKRLSQIAMGNSFGIPQDCQTIAYAELISLEARIKGILEEGNVRLDSYTRAHLKESASRIAKVVKAELTLSRP